MTLNITTPRLHIRWLTENDATFIYRLYNTELFLKFVGDKQLHSVEAAREYLLNGPIAMYQRIGIGLYMVETLKENTPIGICGLIKRDFLDDIDIGYGFLPEYFNHGYAYEAAKAVIDHAQNTLKLKRLVAISSPDNQASIKLLNKLGLIFEKNIQETKNSPITSLFGVHF
ncbi:GNAT family N-acetyltransferase [Endozoicomonas sp. SM1973]|uniref:GNAT family N-acetyltransferase n=1 Tax=Spartinivicinus marinus TaxID=2994442 RepID=A0A853I4K3_9GAMM|nr:GNAT family N-acetyltransferase [Spartinivicinus marinus]MCX4025890.1 GNAT family N-acetyltransferase [Spartinivicinus marinus]NYZ68840.1 GNAT family N-acetyltransferase [Spartinivicinus marinus]